MNIEDIVIYWKRQTRTEDGLWLHPDDREILSERNRHTFNLDFPVGPFIGNVVCSPVVVLGLNAGYHETGTAKDFDRGEVDIRGQLEQNAMPDKVDWKNRKGAARSDYYRKINYGELLFDGRAVMVDACAYRSKSLSNEPKNKKIAEDLPSVKFARRWLLEAVLPLANAGRRLVVAKRWSLWNASSELRTASGVVMDPCPQSSNITGGAKEHLRQWLTDNGFGVWNP